MLSGMMGAPAFRPDVVYPQSLFDQIRQVVGDYPMDVVQRDRDGGYDLAALDRMIENRRQLFSHLLCTKPADLVFVVVNYVDHVQHAFLGDARGSSDGREIEDLVLYAYQAADRLLGELLQLCGPETHVLVVSDHGFCPGRIFLNMRRLMLESGLQCLKAGRQRGGVLRRLIRMIPRGVRRRVPVSVRQPVVQSAARDEVDWARSKVYSRRTSWAVSLNLQGREPEGIIPLQEYEQERERIARKLEATCARHRQLGKVRFYTREELYSGPELRASDDLICKPEDDRVMPVRIDDPTAPLVLTPRQMTFYAAHKRYLHVGAHAMDGILIAAGPRIKSGASLQTAHLLDVTPTILELLEVSHQEPLEGRVLREMLR